jgi:hypothetical protein
MNFFLILSILTHTQYGSSGSRDTAAMSPNLTLNTESSILRTLSRAYAPMGRNPVAADCSQLLKFASRLDR